MIADSDIKGAFAAAMAFGKSYCNAFVREYAKQLPVHAKVGDVMLETRHGRGNYVFTEWCRVTKVTPKQIRFVRLWQDDRRHLDEITQRTINGRENVVYSKSVDAVLDPKEKILNKNTQTSFGYKKQQGNWDPLYRTYRVIPAEKLAEWMCVEANGTDVAVTHLPADAAIPARCAYVPPPNTPAAMMFRSMFY